MVSRVEVKVASDKAATSPAAVGKAARADNPASNGSLAAS